MHYLVSRFSGIDVFVSAGRGGKYLRPSALIERAKQAGG